MNIYKLAKRYYELNENRDVESIEEWNERIGLWNSIRTVVQRDLKKRPVEKCVLCSLPLLDTVNVHMECSENRVSYDENVDKTSKRFMYCLYRNNMLMYIGIAVNPHMRFRQHLIDKDVQSMRVMYGDASAIIESKEKAYIHKYYPPLNNRLHHANGSPHLASDMMTKTFTHTEAMTQVREAVYTSLDEMYNELEVHKARIKYLEQLLEQPKKESFDAW